MNRFIIVTTFLAAAAAVPLKSMDWRIVGGSTAEDGQFPYQASLRLYKSHNCGGSIMNDMWILTAAHCVRGSNARDLSIVVGSNKLNEGGDEYQVDKFIFHENYDHFDILNDIAIVKLVSSITFSSKVQAIALNTDEIGGGKDLMLSGWGSTRLGGQLPNDLQFLKMISVDTEECKEKQKPFIVDENMICSFNSNGKGACHGDSGGPLVYKGTVCGIVSWGRPCAIGYPDVFTRVSKFIDWIRRNMK